MAAAAALFVIGALGPVQAVVGGLDNSGPLSRSALMVLSSKGGICSAVAVAPDVVLTAGHCASGAGEYRVHYKRGDGSPELILPAARAVHPGYDAKAIAARRRSIDLALIRLPEPLPDRFAVAALSSGAAAAGTALTLGGYGLGREGEPRSTGTFRVADLVLVEPYGASTILVWAADPAKAGAGACEGDSGGPIARSGEDAVLAITSWAAGAKGKGCGEISQGVLVAPQRAWIDLTLKAWGRSAVWR